MDSEGSRTESPKDVVRRGYDAVSRLYDDACDADTKYEALLGDLPRLIPARGAVLDVGCGSGVPVARALVAAGHRVTGTDISEVQIRRARERVPQAEFIRGDATAAAFEPASFDAVVSLYALIHVPPAQQPPLLGASPDGCVRAAGSWPPPDTVPGPDVRTTGAAAGPRCGGAVRTPPPAVPGSPGPG